MARHRLRTQRPGPLSGIDYLTLLDQQHHRDLWRRLHLADPASAPPWQQRNLITCGRLLTGAV